jgi:hydrogenase 3 maturation protease
MGVDRRLVESLARWRAARVVILGIGNTLKGDDAAGPVLCARLSGKVRARVIEAGAVPENYIGPVLAASPEVLLIVDAVDFGGRPGQIRLYRSDEIPQFTFSTHALSLHLSLDLIRRERNVEICVLGIQAGRTGLGDSLSPAVRRAVEALADILIQLFPPDP